MKKAFLVFILSSAVTVISISCFAQIRKVPAEVTEALKSKISRRLECDLERQAYRFCRFF